MNGRAPIKLHDYVTGREETGAAAEDVGEEMDELLKEVSEIADKDALTAVAYFHAKFENIHPFVDGKVTLRYQQNVA